MTDGMPVTSLFVGANEPSDSWNLSELEMKHLPVIEAPESVKARERFEVTVEVGRLRDHPNEYNHFIQFIDLYADETYLCRASLVACMAFPKVTFLVTLQAPAEELRAYAHCNMHGTWLGRKPVNMK